MVSFSLATLVAGVGIASGTPLLPIFFMHGVGDNHNEFGSMQDWIREIDPNVTMYSLPVCDDTASYANLWDQGQQIMDRIREQIAASPDIYQDGYTFLSHSQGALTARTVVERMDDHNIHTFIGLAGPQAGEFGIPKACDNELLCELSKLGKDLVFSVVFTGLKADVFQQYLSFANFWNDPRPSYALGTPHQDYLDGNTFLPVLNNDPQRATQGPFKKKDDTEAARYKANLLRLKQAVFTAGTTDDMIMPYNSGVWEFYDATGKNIVPLKETALWTEDWLGLRELDESGRLNLSVAEGVCHTCWAHDKDVFRKYIAPQLPSRPSAAASILV